MLQPGQPAEGTRDGFDPTGRRAQASALTPLLPADAVEFAQLAAHTAAPVLLSGETGTGKTFLARAIHLRSPRARKPFLRINCASIPDALFEREMFGHVRGAFTDAKESRPGAFEAADGGTLLLDELAELPLYLQPKLLQVLDEEAVRRIGSTRPISVNVRLISATNRDVYAMVLEGRFRQDLFYRCAVLEYRIQPVRERRAELPGIIQSALGTLGTDHGGDRIDDDALEMLCRYAWPGNLREIENVLRSALAAAGGGVVRARDLPERIRSALPARVAVPWSGREARRRRYAAPDAERERIMIEEALAAESGNRTRAAARLGMARSTLWVKLQRYRIGTPGSTTADGSDGAGPQG